MIEIQVILFGPAREIAGKDTVQVTLPDAATVDDLKAQLASEFPKWRSGINAVRFAIDDAFVSGTHLLSDQDQVSVIPPVSGGMESPSPGWVHLSASTLDVAACHAYLADHSAGDAGGDCVFVGRTRNEQHETNGPLKRLSYEAHDTMALVQMKRLVAAARERWPISSVVLAHRVGDVEIGEASVVIGVSCGHRAEAFDACRWLIDELKKEVPIWKREVWETGATSWSGAQDGGPERNEDG